MSKYIEIKRDNPEQVRLHIRKNVLARWGEPTVDFPSLTDLIFEQAGMPLDTEIKLFSGRWVGGEYHLKQFARGAYNPLTHTIYSAVGVNVNAGLPHPSHLPGATWEELRDSAPNMAMSKLIRNALQASHVGGEELYGRERELYVEHAADIRFLDASADAR
ncbi:MAG TPA: hypothetical protein VFH99_00320 [Candidatus Saccharimonadales bacterium]|nr:hypothetical protein [Candidatus Saccharimonadales bacterium]